MWRLEKLMWCPELLSSDDVKFHMVLIYMTKTLHQGGKKEKLPQLQQLF